MPAGGSLRSDLPAEVAICITAAAMRVAALGSTNAFGKMTLLLQAAPGQGRSLVHMLLTKPLNLSKAAWQNRYYAFALGWNRRIHQILIVLGYSYYCPSEDEFSNSVAEWQSAHAPLTPDGVIGPKTWASLEPHTAFTPGPAEPTPPDWLKRLPRKKAKDDLVSHYHGTSLAEGKKFIDIDITPYLLREVSILLADYYKDFTDFGKGFYTFDETGRRNAFGRAKRRFAEWSVVEFQFTKEEIAAAKSADLFYATKKARPANSPVLPNSAGRAATWLDFVEYNRGIRRSPNEVVIQRPGDEDYTDRYSIIIGPLWVPRDSGIDDGPPKRPDDFHQFNWGQRGLNVLNRPECKARRLLHTKKTEASKCLEVPL